jgi:signal transduction histidine kinase/DNA-binding NarL/FixJ family response regulator
LESRRSARRARFLALAGGALVVFVAGEALLRGPALHLFVDVVWTAAALHAALRCARTALRRRGSRVGRAWGWLAAGCAAWFLGMLRWTHDEVLLGVVTPFPTAAELGFLAMPVCAAAGLFTMRGEAASGQLTLKQVGDLGVVVASLTFAGALTLYAPAVEHGETPLYAATALAYPVLHVGAFVFGLIGLWQQPPGLRRRIFGLLLAAIAMLAVLTTLYAVELLTRSYRVGNALDVFWVVVFLLVVWAASEEDWGALGPEQAIEKVRAADLAVVPAALLAIVAVGWAFHDRVRPELAPILALSGGVFAVSIALREWGVHRIERALRERARAEAERRARLVESLPIGIARVDAEGRVVESNARFDALVGERGRDLLALAWEDAGLPMLVRRALQSGVAGSRERVESPGPLQVDGAALRVSISPAPDVGEGALVLLEDVTDQTRLASELLQSQKMQAVGTLAGGIAHDFNNLLSGMIAGVMVLRRTSLPEAERAQMLDQLDQAMWRGAELTQRLLALSRRREPVRGQVDVGAVMERVAALLSRSIDETIAVRAQLPPGRVMFEGDGGQLEQALLNLGINARGAMRPHPHFAGGGDLCFSLSLDESRGGHCAVIRVKDDGVGIPAALRERIFEPFFTTKELGEGTGLGLAMVYAFVQDHAGSIELDSAEGRGTTFTIRLPASDVSLAPAEDEASAELPRGTERILVVDDREPALFALRTILGERGYQVSVAGNGVEALAAIERHGREGEDGTRRSEGAFDLVITDAMMRRMGGRDLLAAMRSRHIDIEVVLATGHDGEAHRGTTGFAAVLRKPFHPAEVARVVRTVLDGRRQRRADALHPQQTGEADALPTGAEGAAQRSTKSSSLP